MLADVDAAGSPPPRSAIAPDPPSRSLRARAVAGQRPGGALYVGRVLGPHSGDAMP